MKNHYHKVNVFTDVVDKFYTGTVKGQNLCYDK